MATVVGATELYMHKQCLVAGQTDVSGTLRGIKASGVVLETF
jgi:hypothetical protein